MDSGRPEQVRGNAENRRNEEQPQLSINQRPWWPFIPLSHYMVPLLHCKISAKVRSQDSIETKMFKVIKSIGVKLTLYHGGSLNGKDIIKLMNNATFVFDNLALMFKQGKRPDCLLTDEQIDEMCLYFREVFVLWDGAFSLTRTVNPTEQEILTYHEYFNSAVQGCIEL